MRDEQSGDIIIQTTRVNATEGYRWFDSTEPIGDTIFDGTAPEELRSKVYHEAVKEYGRCTGKVYRDVRRKTNDEGGETWDVVHCGWVFVKREKYDDSGEHFLCETWVTISRVVEPARPTIIETFDLGGKPA